MLNKAVKLLTNPQKYVPLSLKILQQQFCVFFQNSSFFMQGQMDIHPKSRWYNEEFTKKTGGFFLPNDRITRKICNIEPWDNTRRDMLILLLRTILARKINGDLVEVGVYKGYTARLIHYFIPERRLHLFDTFEGFPEKSINIERKKTGLNTSTTLFNDTSIVSVRKYISPINENVFFYQGYFPDTIPDNFESKTFAFVHLDADLYKPTLEGLRFFYPRMNPYGIIVVHDYNTWPGARKAVDEYFYDKEELPIPMPDKSGSALIIKKLQK